eukprot:7375277-Pyramimonas_sp.AAC.1
MLPQVSHAVFLPLYNASYHDRWYDPVRWDRSKQILNVEVDIYDNVFEGVVNGRGAEEINAYQTSYALCWPPDLVAAPQNPADDVHDETPSRPPKDPLMPLMMSMMSNSSPKQQYPASQVRPIKYPASYR